MQVSRETAKEEYFTYHRYPFSIALAYFILVQDQPQGFPFLLFVSSP
jgi:hypothetical protein